ncbi:MAG: prolyl oligopeptidase family serine peptidase [Anaerolineae bacterium]|nr:prolyl oligopeptidase family serine peptidase [Anaerolineae bacterium]
MGKQSKPFGTWESPVTAHMLAGSIRLSDVQWDSDGETLIWHERRGAGGVLVSKKGTDAIRELTNSEFSVSGRVGYGGGTFTVSEGQVYFASNGRLYKVPLTGGTPQAITPKFGAAAAPRVSHDGKWLVFVHSYEDDDVIALVDTDGQYWSQKIASGDDFVMQPTWHPNGKQIAYVAWNHPNMPWNGTELRLITLEDNGRGMPIASGEETLVGDDNTAIFQPEFSPDGRYISYISDATGWGHIYLYDTQSGEHQQITSGEHEHIIPAWVQGLYTYGWTSDSRALYYICSDSGFRSVWIYDVEHKTSLRVRDLDTYTDFAYLAVANGSEKIALVASASTIPERVISYSAEVGMQIVRRATTEILTVDDLSVAEAISWTGHDGETAHGLYYAPKNARFESNGTPPLMVLVHGGPTSNRDAKYYGDVQFFTSRGYAVLQVNHRGSTGYGKAYMNKHKGKWGVYDVQDSITGAQHLVDKGLAHADKLVIMGGSAGGYTVLQTLVDKPSFFKAGVCSYGIANQFTLVMDTHKFESRYSDWLLGTLPAAADVYRDRSPIFRAKNITDALIVFQGDKDVVVPKNQSDTIVAASATQWNAA